MIAVRQEMEREEGRLFIFPANASARALVSSFDMRLW
jgi:hypothetical protein